MRDSVAEGAALGRAAAVREEARPIEQQLALAQQTVTAGLRIVEMIGAGVELEEVLTELIRMVESQTSALASVLVLAPDGRTLRHGAAPSLPAEYVRAIDGASIGASAGSCGTAAFTGQQVIVEDIATHPLWEGYRDLALPHGLRACWATPIVTGGAHVLGTFALYYREPKGPTPRELELVARVTALAGVAILRQQSNDRLRALSAHVEAAREGERTRLAREIHDDLGQALTALKMDVAWLGRRLQAGSTPLPDGTLERVNDMVALTDDVIQRVRRIASALRPGVLDDLGLVAALEWQASDFEARTGIACWFSASVERESFEPHVSTAVFRIVQEALTNVVRHAEASAVSVCLVESGNRLRCEVQDDGKGIQGDTVMAQRSLGLLGMRERARALGGTLLIGGRARHGTRLVLELPLSPLGSTS